MCDTISEESTPNQGTGLPGWVNLYCDTDLEASRCDARNRVLIAVVSGSGEEFVQFVLISFEKEADLARRKNLCKIVYDVLSRTENLKFGENLVILLSQCLEEKVCTHFAIVALRAWLQRHVKLEGVNKMLLEKLEKTYEIALSQKIATLTQQPRIDFLWLTHFMLEAYRQNNQKPLEHFIQKFCTVVAGEKDPRNLLVLFDLIAKFAKENLDDEEVQALSNLYTTYYPIQFTPPKNDVIGIKPAQLKARLLNVFKACSKFGPYSMEVMIDCLYSGYGTKEEHTTVLSDTLRYMAECVPVYGIECFSSELDTFLEVITSEFFGSSSEKSGQASVGGPDTVMEHMVPGSEACNIDLNDANKIGKAYYEHWSSVSKQLQLFGDILKVYMESIDMITTLEQIQKFLVLLRKQLVIENSKIPEVNAHAGYFLDVLCGIQSYHRLLLENVLVPLCNDIVFIFTEYKQGLIAESELCAKLTRVVPVVTNTLFAKIVSQTREPIPPGHVNSLVLAGLCCIQLQDARIFRCGLKLVTLAITSSNGNMLEQVLAHCMKESQLMSKHKSLNKEYIRLYAESILAMYKCHFTLCAPIVESVSQLMDELLNADDIEETLVSYVGGAVDLSHEFAEMIAITIDKNTDEALVNKVVDACCKCLLYVCENPESRIVYTTVLFSLAMAVNRDKASKRLRAIVSYTQLYKLYRSLLEVERDGNISNEILQIVTNIIPQYMSITLENVDRETFQQIVEDGLELLLPVLINDIMQNELVEAVLEYAKCSKMTVVKLEVISWLLKRWVGGPLYTKALGTSTGFVDDVSNGDPVAEVAQRFNRIVSYGLEPFVTTYILEVVDYGTVANFDLKGYFRWVPHRVIVSFVSRMFPFLPEKLSSTLESLGFSLKTLINARMSYADLFLVDGTRIDDMPIVARMQYKFVKSYCHAAPRKDMGWGRQLIRLLNEMETSLDVMVAIETIAVHMDDVELTQDGAIVANLVVRQYIQQWKHLDAVKTCSANMQSQKANGTLESNRTYGIWLQHEFLFLSQCILLRILCQQEHIGTDNQMDFDFCNTSASSTSIKTVKTSGLQLEGHEWEELVDVAVSVAIETTLPVCRILAILIVHCIVKKAPNTISNIHCKSVMKRMCQCLGDKCHKARTVALACRHKWLQK